jgi:shikimate dehydrogenase
MRKFGLIGYPLSHSFSKKYFTEKFARENIQNAEYELFELKSIDELPELLTSQPNLCGLNVTIPYKQQVIPFLSELNEIAAEIGAVNVIKITKDQKLIGYNSDYYGFLHSLQSHLSAWSERPSQLKALVLGAGGASKAVQIALRNLQIPFKIVVRRNNDLIDSILYEELIKLDLSEYPLIINTTPLGMHPKIEEFPMIPYQKLTTKHFLYDLVYNPIETAFLQKGLAQNAKILNGLEMLYGQAEKAWEIWNI